MPGGRGPGGPGGGGYGGGGMLPRNTTMSHANQLYDWIKTTRSPQKVGGIAGSGYVPSESFSFIDLASRIKLAWMKSYHHEGTTRFRAFVGNYQVLTHNVSRQARLEQMTTMLGKRHSKKEISDQQYGQRLMYEADRYYSWLRSKHALTEEQYRKAMTEFADSHGIEYVFEDEPVRSR